MNKQKAIAIGAIIGGLAVLPIVFAGNYKISNSNGNVKTGSNTDMVNEQLQQFNTTNHTQNLQPRQTAQGMTCEYYAPASQVGFYHFKFPEVASSDLVTINGYKFHRDAVPDLKRMLAAAKADGVTLTIGSTFRSVEYQRGIVQRKKKAGQSDKQIYLVSSHPGFSEHHTGFALDFSPINHSFAKTKAYAWLQQHANQYHFYKTFTPEYSKATGVSQESWHWKWLGNDTAKSMLANGNCYSQPKSSWHPVNN